MKRIRFALGILLCVGLGQELVAQKLLSEGIKDLATQISASAAKGQKRRIAVAPLRELDGGTSVLGTYVAEELITGLFSIGTLEVVERGLLDKVLGELKLNASGVIDPDTAKQVGKLAGVDAIVTGTITDLQSFVVLNCRLIDTQSGRIFAATQTKIIKDDDVKKIITTAVGAGGTGGASTQVAGGNASSRPRVGTGADASPRTLETDKVRATVVGLSFSNNRAKATILIEALKDLRAFQIAAQCLYCSGPYTTLATDDGQQLLLQADLDASWFKGTNIVQGLKARITLTFGASQPIDGSLPVSLVLRYYPDGCCIAETLTFRNLKAL